MFVNGCHSQISVLTFNIICLFCVQYVFCAHDERQNRHLFPLLGYLHGYKIGQNFAYQLPPFVLSPVLILPSVNQQQSVNVQKSTSGENYQENGGTFQIISPSKLISNNTEAIFKYVKIEGTGQKEAAKVNILEKTDSPTKTSMSNSDEDTFRQIITNDTDITTFKTTEVDNENATPITEMTDTEIGNLTVTTKLDGPYPTAVYKNENISTLLITTSPLPENATSSAPLVQYNLSLPSIENTQNFQAKTMEIETNASNINKQLTGLPEMANIYPANSVSSTFRGYSYPNPWYNSVADKISITRNSYTNYESRLPPAYDDRWQSFSSLRKSYPTSDFRPLAGLYHDGFLHKHLIKKTGFIPVHSKYFYYQ
ncbi:jg8063 [Pararge aegeria aegeria]|uniref:Jg8063 protein n=1 Tax=Pararge aegeria aegeria TaxID=348720 RepID=A0A8S4QFI3_9NEOP|nr:jg8063 [Pararge aegeria aegeria]